MTLTELRSARRREGRGPAEPTPATEPTPPLGARSGVALEPERMAATLDDLELEFTEVRLGSVAKITAFFGLATLALWFGATLFFWAFASSAGLISSFEQLVRDIGFEGFRIEAGPVFLAIALVGAVCVVSLLTVVLVATASYNAFAAFFGGLRCVVAPRSLADTSASTTGANTTDPNTTDESHASVRSDDAAPAREP